MNSFYMMKINFRFTVHYNKFLLNFFGLLLIKSQSNMISEQMKYSPLFIFAKSIWTAVTNLGLTLLDGERVLPSGGSLSESVPFDARTEWLGNFVRNVLWIEREFKMLCGLSSFIPCLVGTRKRISVMRTTKTNSFPNGFQWYTDTVGSITNVQETIIKIKCRLRRYFEGLWLAWVI